jgi:centromeric protein E
MLGSKSSPGVLPLAVNEIMNCISQAPHRAFLIRCSYIEIYKETITDLLSKKTLEVHESKAKGIHVDSQETIISNADEIMACLATGEEHRHTGRTGMNERSSRSHTIFRIIVESRIISEDVTAPAGNVTLGTLNLVDLAGSESVRTTNATGERLVEAKMINTSLLTLSRVIKELAESGKSVNYRESKLTRVLQPSLAGNTKLTVICCINPSRQYQEESKTTLEFAAHANGIRMSAVVNTILDENAKMKTLQKELAAVREQLKKLQEVAVAGAGAGATITTAPTMSVTTTLGVTATASATATASPLTSSSESLRLPFLDASNAANMGVTSSSLSLTATPAADLIGKTSVELIAHYEAQLQNMRTRMFIGGTKHGEVSDTGYTELGRIKSFTAIRSQAAMGRSKRHRETWCPAAGGGGELRKSFLMGLKKGGGGVSSLTATVDGGDEEEEEEEEEDEEEKDEERGRISNGSSGSASSSSSSGSTMTSTKVKGLIKAQTNISSKTEADIIEKAVEGSTSSSSSSSKIQEVDETVNHKDEEDNDLTDGEAEADNDESDNDGIVVFNKVRRVDAIDSKSKVIADCNDNHNINTSASTGAPLPSLYTKQDEIITELKLALVEKDATIIDLHAQADAMLERNEAVEAEMHRLAAVENSLGAEVQALTAKLIEETTARKAVDALVHSTSAEFIAKIAELEMKLASARDETASAVANAQSAETKAWAAEKASKAADARARASKDLAATAEDKVADYIMKLSVQEESHRNALEAAQVLIEEAQARASASSSKASLLASDLGEARAEAAGLEAKYSALTAQLGATSESAAQLAELQESAARELSLLRSTLATTQEERNTLKNEVNILSGDAKAMKREISDLTFKLTSLNEDADRSEREMEEANSKITASDSKNEELLAQISTLTTTIETLTAKINDSETQCSTLQSRLTELLSTIESLRAYTATLESTNMNAQSEIEKLSLDAIDKETNLRTTIGTLTTQLEIFQADEKKKALLDAENLNSSLKNAQAEITTAVTETTIARTALAHATIFLKAVQAYFTHLNALPTSDADPAMLADYLQDLAPSTNAICDELQSIIAPILALATTSREVLGGPIASISSAADSVSSAIFMFNEVAFNASGLIYDIVKARDAAIAELEMQSSEQTSAKQESDSAAAAATTLAISTAVSQVTVEHAHVIEEMKTESLRSIDAMKAEAALLVEQTEQLKEELSRTKTTQALIEERRQQLESEIVFAKQEHAKELQVAVDLAVQEAARQAATKGTGVEGLLQNYAAEMSQIKVQLSLASGEVDAAKESARLAIEASTAAKIALNTVQSERDAALAAASAAEARAQSLTLTLQTTRDSLDAYMSKENSEKMAESALSLATENVARLTARVNELEGISSLVETLQAETDRARSVKDSIASENAKLSLKNYELGLAEAAAKEAAVLATNDAERARADLIGLRSQLEVAKNDMSRLSSQLEMSRLELGSLQATYERTSTQLEQAREATLSLQAQVTKKEDALQEYSLRFNEAESYAQSAIAALEEQRSQEAQAAAAALAESTLQLDAANAAIIDLRGTIDERGEATEAAETRALDLANALEMADMRIEKLNAQLAAVRGAAQQAEALSAARGADIAAYSERANTFKEHLQAAETENARLTARCERLDRAKLTDAQTKKMIAIKKEYDVLKVQVHELSSEKLRLETLLAATSASTKSQESKIVSDLQARLIAAEAAAGKFSDMRAALEVALEEAKGGIVDANALAKDKGEEAERLRSQAIDARAALHTAQDTIAKMASSSAVLAATLNSATPALLLAGLEEHHVATTAAPSEVATRARDVVDALSIKIQQLSSIYTTALQQISKAEAASTSKTIQFENEIQVAKEQICKGELEISKLKETVSKLQVDSKTQKSKAIEAEKEAESVRARIHQIERINADLASKAQDKSNALNEAAAEHARSLQFLEKENLALMMELRSLRSTAASAQALATSNRPAPRLSVIKSSTAVYTGGGGGGTSAISSSRMSMGGNAHSMQAQMFASQHQHWQQQQVLMQHQNIHAQLSAQPSTTLPMTSQPLVSLPMLSAPNISSTTQGQSTAVLSSSMPPSAMSANIPSSVHSLHVLSDSSAGDTSMIDALAATPSAPTLPQLSSSQLSTSGVGRRQPLSALSFGSSNINSTVSSSESSSASTMAMSNLAASKLGGTASSRVILAPRGNGNGGVVVGGGSTQTNTGEKEGECAQQ